MSTAPHPNLRSSNSSRLSPSRKWSKFDHHVARHCVVLQRVDRQVLAVSRALEAPVRHLVHQREVSVYPSTTVLKTARYPHRPRDIAGPDRRGQAVFGLIGPFDSFFRFGEPRHGHHRTKHFTTNDLIGLQRPGYYRRFVKEPATGPEPPARC